MKAPEDRRLRIELLRTRAGYERLALRRSACELIGAVQPEALVSQAGLGLRASGLRWVVSVLGLARRYPIMLSAGSALISGARKSNPYVRAGVAGLLIWRLLRGVRRT
ncbi:MAG: hypothetical protein L0H54_05875 [Alcaligenaceae bacterium]|nr:hypothetical protein [Alcaligenaceae bacterium]